MQSDKFSWKRALRRKNSWCNFWSYFFRTKLPPSPIKVCFWLDDNSRFMNPVDVVSNPVFFISGSSSTGLVRQWMSVGHRSPTKWMEFSSCFDWFLNKDASGRQSCSLIQCSLPVTMNNHWVNFNCSKPGVSVIAIACVFMKPHDKLKWAKRQWNIGVGEIGEPNVNLCVSTAASAQLNLRSFRWTTLRSLLETRRCHWLQIRLCPYSRGGEWWKLGIS